MNWLFPPTIKPKKRQRKQKPNTDSDSSSRIRSLSFSRKLLVLDLDETLIHSSSRAMNSMSCHTVEVLIDTHICLYYVYKRPNLDHFLKHVSQWFDLIIFTASLPEYADPVIDWIDSNNVIRSRYFRSSCQVLNNQYVKDLSLLGHDLSQICILDNSPISYLYNQDNAIPIDGWTSDPDDTALLDLLPFFDALRLCHDVRSILSLRL